MLHIEKNLVKKTWEYIKAIRNSTNRADVEHNIHTAMDVAFGLNDLEITKITMMMNGASPEDFLTLKNHRQDKKEQTSGLLWNILISNIPEDLRYFISNSGKLLNI